MKIKYNINKDNFSIKDLSPTEFAVINALMSHVRLGSGTEASKAAFDFNSGVENGNIEQYLPDVSVFAEPSEEYENVDFTITNPTLNVYVD